MGVYLSSIISKKWWLIAALLLTTIAIVILRLPSTEETLDQAVNFGDWKKAESWCNQILEKNPNDADALVARARLSGMVGKSTEALADCIEMKNYMPTLL